MYPLLTTLTLPAVLTVSTWIATLLAMAKSSVKSGAGAPGAQAP